MKTTETLQKESPRGVGGFHKNTTVAGTLPEFVSNGQAKNTAILPSMTLHQMLDNLVWIGSISSVGFLNNPGVIWPYKRLVEYTETKSFEVVDSKRKVLVSSWKLSPKRKNAFACDFMPGADPIFFDEKGNQIFNTWRPIERWQPKVDVQPFLDHIAYLIPDKTIRETFLDYLAHIEQYPGVLPAYGWLHIAINTGTGRNWMSDALSSVWNGYVASNLDLSTTLEATHNDEISSKLLAVVDEVQEAAGENPHRRANRLKSLVTAKFRNINLKYGAKYTERNVMRWMVFSNHDNALPLSDNDRRWYVTRHTAEPLDAEYYKKLYAWSANPESINAIGWYLSKRDISGFNPGERPPMTDAKKAALDASKSLIQHNAEILVKYWPSDIITNEAITDFLSEDGDNKKYQPAMRRALEELRCISAKNPLRIGDKVYKYWFIRNANKSG